MAETKVGTGFISELNIQNNSKTLTQDIRGVVKEVAYFENILNHSVSATITLEDGTDVKNSLPIVGGETVNLSFSDTFEDSVDVEPGYDEKKFRVYKIANRQKVRDNIETYTLLCTSDHLMKSQYMSVDNAFKGKKADDIVSNILETYFDHDLTEVDPTQGLHSFTFNRVPPFKAINQIIDETESTSDGSSCYFFFETNDGYNLRNLDNMLTQQPLTKDDKKIEPYIYISGEVKSDNINEGKRILEMTEGTSFDFLNGIIQGQYGTETKYFDPIRKRLASQFYLHESDWNSTIHSNPNPLISQNISQEFGNSPSLEKYMVSNYLSVDSDYIAARDSLIRNTFRRKQNIAARRKSLLSRIENNKVNIMIYGDSRIMAGQSIDILVPTTGQKTKTGEITDQFVSGRYLIVGVHHNISDTEYRTIMTVVKDSYVKSPDYDFGDF